MSDREELVELVRKIVAAKGTQQEVDAWIDELQSRVSHPAVTDLIYHQGGERSPEAIVDSALAYQPIRLGPSPS